MIRAAIVKRFPPGPESAGFHLDIDFEADAGVTALYGPSGSGKTLTLDMIAGFVAPDSGRILLDDRILFDGESGVNLPPQRRGYGYVFQNFALFPHMTLRENLAFAAHALPRLERHRRIAEQLERFKLADMAGRYPHELSGGQKQRGSIARALVAAPRLVLLDEPERGLDTPLRADLYELIQSLRGSLSVPVILVTHDLEECFALAERVLIYEAGRIIHRGAPFDLLRNPRIAAVARLVGGFNIWEAEVVSLDPGRQRSGLLLLGEEIAGPYLPGCFKGDKVRICARAEDLRIATRPGDNRIRANLRRTVDRPQWVRAEFDDCFVDVPREAWRAFEQEDSRAGWWIEIPPESVRLIT